MDTLSPDRFRIVFLKKVGDIYQLTNGSYLSVVAAPDSSSNVDLTDPFTGVVSNIVAVLFSDETTQQEKHQAIWQLSAVEHENVLPALKQFLFSKDAHNDEFLRVDALVAILGKKDDSVLGQAESELLDSGNPEYWKSNLLFAISRAVPPSKAISIFTKVLSSSSAGMRTHAAEAFYQTNSTEAIAPLLTVLEDSDPDVAFAVMQGLGNLTKDYEWRPQVAE